VRRATYNFEHELREHQRAAHHAVVSDRKPQASEKESVKQQDKVKAKTA
jgi:hypothetical protein